VELNSIKDFLITHLVERILPFWLERGIDWDNGGFFTCFNNLGDKLVSKNKYVWSEGRFLWALSHLYRHFQDMFPQTKLEKLEGGAKLGAEFLRDHAILDDGSCAWLLTERGLPVEYKGDVDGEHSMNRHPAHLGIEADEFLIYGFVEFSVAFDKPEYFRLACDIYRGVVDRIESGKFFSAPYGVPTGYRSHGIPMLLLETTREMIEGASYWKDPFLSELVEIGFRVAEESVVPFRCNERRILVEMVKSDGGIAPDEMIGSYYNPGHTLEHAWFLIDFAREVERLSGGGVRNGLGNKPSGEATLFDANKWKSEGLRLIDWMVEKCWDNEFGGIPQFLHVDWGAPRGRVLEVNADDKILGYLRNHWDKKLWWVHSEALYALLLAYTLTGDNDYWNYYLKVHDYTFGTFPNSDEKIGEWIQIRRRDGTPVNDVVALPVKDPFHIMRALMFMIKLLNT